MTGAYGGGMVARLIPGTVLLVAFAVIMVAAGAAMLRGRKDTNGTVCDRPLPMVRITVIGPRRRHDQRTRRRRRRLSVGTGTGASGRVADARCGRVLVGRHLDAIVRRTSRASHQRADRLAARRFRHRRGRDRCH